MLSIFIMYSNDRRKALDYTLGCLQDMNHYEACQKTLIVDGKTQVVLPGWDVVEVPRIADQFSWSNMWQAGVASAKHDVVFYLDSDRMLPADYLDLILKHVVDDVFLFSSKHFMMNSEDYTLEQCKLFLKKNCEPGVFLDDDFLGMARFDPRFREPQFGPGKNVMSGNTAFTKRTFFRLGGVDPWYVGHGAYADTDFHLTAQVGGCKFIDLCAPELHFFHHKRDPNNVELDEITLRRMGLDNFVYYCTKWGLPLGLAEEQAVRLGIRNPRSFVAERARACAKTPT